jgi:hypothetical protein
MTILAGPISGDWTGIPGIIQYRRISPPDPKIFAGLALSAERQPRLEVGQWLGRVPQSDRSRQRARLSCFLPPWAKPESFRAVRWRVPTPRTCSNDGSNKRGCRRTIHLTRSERPASQILWKTTAPWRPLALTHITKSFLKLEVFAAFANARSPLLLS